MPGARRRTGANAGTMPRHKQADALVELKPGQKSSTRDASSHCMLGHKSHNSIDFHQLYEEKQTVTLCLPCSSLDVLEGPRLVHFQVQYKFMLLSVVKALQSLVPSQQLRPTNPVSFFCYSAVREGRAVFNPMFPIKYSLLPPHLSSSFVPNLFYRHSVMNTETLPITQVYNCNYPTLPAKSLQWMYSTVKSKRSQFPRRISVSILLLQKTRSQGKMHSSSILSYRESRRGRDWKHPLKRLRRAMKQGMLRKKREKQSA